MQSLVYNILGRDRLETVRLYQIPSDDAYKTLRSHGRMWLEVWVSNNSNTQDWMNQLAILAAKQPEAGVVEVNWQLSS